ncbi:MAG: SWIM zinc finger family protein [Planctomycetes bacterium]|nr:SWIM zinc finger family protein [Planctomycetota bacterium]
MAYRGSWNDGDWFRPSRPKKVKGGIRARAARGKFGQSWWGGRWVEVLERLHVGARLQRGRNYARSGQVLSIEVERGGAVAQVQGSRSYPYQVDIRVKVLSPAARKKLGQALARQAALAARILAGEMPEEMEAAFEKAGVSLFPTRRGDLRTDCSCPDWSNPCKHIAAVYYLLAEELDRDPLLLLRLRGVERQELLEGVGAGVGAGSNTGKRRSKPARQETPAPRSEPLPAAADAFWRELGELETAGDAAEPPPVTAALPRRLGSFPFWRGEEPFLVAMERLYARLPRHATPAEETPTKRPRRSRRS